MENHLLVFISSVISDMSAERQAAESAIRAVPLSRPWVFEHTPASSLPLSESYLSQVRACDIFVLLLRDAPTDPVKLEVSTAQSASKPLLVFLSAAAPPDVVKYAQSLGVKCAMYDDTSDLAQKVAEAVADELIRGYRQHQVPRTDLTPLGDFLDAVTQGQVKIDIGGDQVIAHGPVATHGGAISMGSGPAVSGQGNIVVTGAGTKIYLGEASIAMTEMDGDSLLGRYLQHVIGRSRFLQLQGIRSGGRSVSIELDRIYIRLRTMRQQTPGAEHHWLEREAALAPGEEGRSRGDGQATIAETMTVAVEQALAGNKRLVVLGDPGSGKTTLLRYLALLYARDLAEGANQVSEKMHLPERGYLPVLVQCRDLGAFLRVHRPADDGAEGCGLVLDFLLHALKGELLELTPSFFEAWLTNGEAVLLLDGLDEVADPDLRRRVVRMIECFARTYPDCRYVVSSRIVGYTGAARLQENFAAATVREFSLADIEEFLSNWHRGAAIGLMGSGESVEAYARRQTGQLMEAIRANERIRELAVNPLMLTVIALVHRDRVKLPDRRVELYAEAVDVLLGKWDEARGVQAIEVRPGRACSTLATNGWSCRRSCCTCTRRNRRRSRSRICARG